MGMIRCDTSFAIWSRPYMFMNFPQRCVYKVFLDIAKRKNPSGSVAEKIIGTFYASGNGLL
jgi:hypothetical protein